MFQQAPMVIFTRSKIWENVALKSTILRGNGFVSPPLAKPGERPPFLASFLHLEDFSAFSLLWLSLLVLSASLHLAREEGEHGLWWRHTYPFRT